MAFQKNFAWGAATSAYQIEGAVREEGKGEHIWDVYTKEPNRIFEGHTGETACDHYHRYREDVKLMKEMGLKAYRFSVDWSRVLPEGTGRVNEQGVAFYNALIDELLANGIEPYLTLYHWELPYELYKRGGWMNPQIVEWFGEYAKLVAERFSDRVTHFFTLNEPQCFVGLGFLRGEHAPGLKAPLRDTFEIAHNALKAHGRAVQMLRQYGRQKLQIGYAPTAGICYPETDKPEDVEAARQALFSLPQDAGNWTWNVTWFSDPVFFGHYPEEGSKRYEPYLPRISDDDMKLISEPIDIYGQNIYNGRCFRMGADQKPEEVKRYDGFPKTAIDWPVTPEALYWGPKFLYERYKTPLYITENGLSCHDVVSLDGKVHDPNRIDFLARYLGALSRAADEIDLRGYFQWSLMDNFEWAKGYSERFGLIYVDYRTQERIMKDSAYWYRDVIQSNGTILLNNEQACSSLPSLQNLKGARFVKMSILKLKPSCKDYLWGGNRLKEEYGKEYDGEVLAETWELSCHPDGPSYIVNGAYAGKTLQQYIDGEGKEVLGTHCRRFRDFPILTKFIDAKDNLSIQVHPDNRYALENEGQYGKTEMWYVMDAGKDAFLYYGFQQEISKEEFEKRIEEDTLLEVLNAVPVQKGDVLFIESGTIHAIGKNILIAEIQQNSNVTYRVYDYGRVGKDGKKRDLHIEKALTVTNRVPIVKDKSSYPHVADCDYFTVDKLNLDGKVMKKMEGNVSEESFASILFLDGKGTISDDKEQLTFQKGDSFFLTAGSGNYTIEGSCDALITTIREKAAPVRIGIDIGGTDTKIGLVDIHQKIIVSETIKTDASRAPEAVIAQIAETTLALLKKQGISFDQCVGVGVGVPGTIDRKNGVVRYSNNIEWENVAIVKQLSEYFPLPIRIANDADCAALGEAVAGAGKDYQDVIMLTLGTGVGVGIILDGNIFTGKAVGGSELGHIVIVEDGEPCTCGRKGCLEAYASATALVRDAKRATGKDLTPQEIFDAAQNGDDALKEIVDLYIRRLGIGIVNFVNIFRPQLVLLGGGLSAQGKTLTAPLYEMMKEGCFGKEKSELPELAIAALGNRAGMIGAASLI